MGEFKAQILGIILVLGIFTALGTASSGTFRGAWGEVYKKINASVGGGMQDWTSFSSDHSAP